MNLRAMGGAAATASNWLNNTIIGQVTPVGLKVSCSLLGSSSQKKCSIMLTCHQKLGWKYFMVFVVTNITNAIVSYFLFPETK